MALIIKEGFCSLDDAVSLRRYYPDQVRRVCSQPRFSRGTPTAYEKNILDVDNGSKQNFAGDRLLF